MVDSHSGPKRAVFVSTWLSYLDHRDTSLKRRLSLAENMLKSSSQPSSFFLLATLLLLALFSAGLFVNVAASGSSMKVVKIINLGSPVLEGPQGIAYDRRNHKVFVVVDPSSCTSIGCTPPTNISVISSESNSVIATIHLHVGIIHTSIAYNSANGELYIAGTESLLPVPGVVFVVNATSDKTVRIVKVGLDPAGITVDPETNKVFVSNEQNGTVSVISGKTNTVIDTLRVTDNNGDYDDFLLGITFDPTNNQVYVSHSKDISPASSGSISVINAQNDKIVANIQLPNFSTPTNLIFDSTNRNLYVLAANPTPLVVVINGTSNKVLNAIGGFPDFQTLNSIAFDKENGNVYVAGSAGTAGIPNLYAISGITNKIVGTVNFPDDQPFGMAWGSSSNLLYVASNYNNRVFVVAP